MRDLRQNSQGLYRASGRRNMGRHPPFTRVRARRERPGRSWDGGEPRAAQPPPVGSLALVSPPCPPPSPRSLSDIIAP
ncbi:hypothetical protein SKAU_G00338330 [Synaphobranchus kaupii]|uniref:Uncharacterized protein n=1 Tax=Synaphobranchus kaupii TaxID=118154 RepID=A0A9Q1EMN9_SYNKA|nr:hypothetical protein SKAU_G00338330 [Synaphobranchus kaupii]